MNKNVNDPKYFNVKIGYQRKIFTQTGIRLNDLKAKHKEKFTKKNTGGEGSTAHFSSVFQTFKLSPWWPPNQDEHLDRLIFSLAVALRWDGYWSARP